MLSISALFAVLTYRKHGLLSSTLMVWKKNTPSEIVMIFLGEPLSNAFYMAFKIALNALPVALNVFTVPLPDDFSLEHRGYLGTTTAW
jgi:hypothetical protein